MCHKIFRNLNNNALDKHHFLHSSFCFLYAAIFNNAFLAHSEMLFYTDFYPNYIC
jgi:hypothetical protein